MKTLLTRIIPAVSILFTLAASATTISLIVKTHHEVNPTTAHVVVKKAHAVVNETRGAIQADYRNGQDEIRAYYAEQQARIISAHDKGLIGDGTASRRMDDLQEACTGRMDALTESCTDRMDRFNN